MQAEIVAVKAYSSVDDDAKNFAKHAAKFPEKNFTDVVPAELQKGDFDALILQAGSVDITNLSHHQNWAFEKSWIFQAANCDIS